MTANTADNARNILLTGGSGSVGMNVCQKLLSEGCHVILLARHPLKEAQTAELCSAGGRLSVVLGDVTEERAVKDTIVKYAITDIIHAAAITPGAESDLTQARTTIEVNCIGTISVLNAAMAGQIPGRFLMLGSISAYGRAALTNDVLVEGQTTADPQVIYEISKFAAERIFLRYRQTGGIRGCVVRIGDVYGPWEHYSGVRPHMSLPYQAAALAQRGEAAYYPRNYSGEWIYGPELAEAVYGLLTAPELHYDVYPLSSGNRWKISEWCDLLQERFPAFRHGMASGGAPVNMCINQTTDNGAMSSQRIREDTGFVSTFGLKESFDDYMRWIDRHPNYVK